MTDPEPATPELGRLARRVAQVATSEEFWTSTPCWRPEVARADVAGQLVAWSDAGVFDVAPQPGAVARFLDGEVTLAQLAEDVAAAAEEPLDAARDMVATLAVELADLAALDGVALPDPGDAPGEPEAGDEEPVSRHVGEMTRTDPESGQEVRVVTEVGPDGNVITTEHLPDGWRRVTTTMTITHGHGPEGMAAAETLVRDRSPAEMVPLDSCLGSKLRNRDDVPLISRRGEDGQVRSVRCHHPEVADRLRGLFGDAFEPEVRGPVEAFVVTPLDGVGPLRIFDGLGRRRGRPRSVEGAAAVVDQILGEREAEALAAADPSEAPVPLGLVLLSGPDGVGHLVPLDALQGVGLVHRLEAAGFRPTWGRAVLHPDGRVASPGTSEPAEVTVDAVLVHAPPWVATVAQGAALLIGDPALPSAPAPRRADIGAWRRSRLSTVVELLSRARWTTLAGALGADLAVDAPS